MVLLMLTADVTMGVPCVLVSSTLVVFLPLKRVVLLLVLVVAGVGLLFAVVVCCLRGGRRVALKFERRK